MTETTVANWIDEFVPNSTCTPRPKAEKATVVEDHGLPFADDPVVEAPEVQLEAPEAVEKVSEPVEATQDEPKGLQFLRAWSLSLVASSVKPMEKALGWVIREHANSKTFDAFVGSDRIAEMTGWDERDVRKRRSALVHAGWLIDTGKTQGRAKVFKLAIPG